MKRLSLNGAWRLDIPGTDYENIPATVPGSVYNDLLNAGRMPDPFWRDNELEALRLMDNTFVYSRSFDAPEDMFSCDRVLLRCEGLDTLAEVKLNGRTVLCASNMHRTYEADVRDALKAGQNDISVRLESPTRHLREWYASNRADGSSDAMVGFPNIRKAHCMYGWDWGPRLPDAGIWRDISIIGVEAARIDQVCIHQEHWTGRVDCEVAVKLDGDGVDLEISAEIIGPDGSVYAPQGADGVIPIEDPRLWWPNGLGDQPLYTVRVVLRANGVEADRWEKRIGLREITVNRQKDEWGEQFCFNVNGVDVFAMGADYIPEDNILPRRSPGRTRRLLQDAKAAHMNCVRVWGGGYYPDDWFFDICDELGLLVWHDFMFACAVYNLTDGFEQNIRAEITDNVRRLRHHASLAIWCGNNEMEQFVAQGEWVSSKKQVADYIKMYEYIFPQILKQEDPDRFYWPSSPSSGGSFDEPQDSGRGDVHYWDVWHGMKPFTEYRKFLFRFASEFGFQSFPCMATIESFTEPEDRNPFSYVMEKHQRNASANGKIAEYLSQMYLYPTSFDAFVYASQLLQAQAMQYGVEHWRRHRGHCMGAVVWQLNDCWPVVSWSSIDYYGRWKALHYYEKRFFAPVLISCHEEGVLSQNTNVNAEPFDLVKSARLNVSNETPEPFRGRAAWSLRRPDASVIREGAYSVDVPPMTALWLGEALDFSDQDTRGCYFSYELEDENGKPVGGGSALFCPPKHFRFVDPKLTARVEGDAVVVIAQAYARSVEIQCGPDVVLEDNFFDMNAGERRVKVVRGVPSRVTARSVYDIR